MEKLVINTEGNRINFAPGEKIIGEASWTLDRIPKKIEINLIWYTVGSGDRDAEIVQSKLEGSPSAIGTTDFSFVIPKGPFSCSGKYISIVWALELIVTSPDDSTKTEIVVSPSFTEVVFDKGANAS